MKQLMIAVAMISVASIAVAASGGDDKAQAQQVFDKLAAGFNAHDGKLAASAWADDGELISPDGQRAQGRAQIAALISSAFDNFLKGVRSNTMTVDSVRRISNDVLWVDGTHTAENATRPDGKIGPMKVHISALLTKRGNTWQILEGRPHVYVPPPAGAGMSAGQQR